MRELQARYIDKWGNTIHVQPVTSGESFMDSWKLMEDKKWVKCYLAWVDDSKVCGWMEVIDTFYPA